MLKHTWHDLKAIIKNFHVKVKLFIINIKSTLLPKLSWLTNPSQKYKHK